jgi:hypothetical protein
MKRPLLLSCVGLTACATGGQTGDEGRFSQDRADGGLPTSLAITEDRVVVPPPFKSCHKDSDCVVVDTDCGWCCANDSVSVAAHAAYQAAYAAACGPPAGPVCDCAPQYDVARCVEGLCTAVKGSAPW